MFCLLCIVCKSLLSFLRFNVLIFDNFRIRVNYYKNIFYRNIFYSYLCYFFLRMFFNLELLLFLNYF